MQMRSVSCCAHTVWKLLKDLDAVNKFMYAP